MDRQAQQRSATSTTHSHLSVHPKPFGAALVAEPARALLRPSARAESSPLSLFPPPRCTNSPPPLASDDEAPASPGGIRSCSPRRRLLRLDADDGGPATAPPLLPPPPLTPPPTPPPLDSLVADAGLACSSRGSSSRQTYDRERGDTILLFQHNGVIIIDSQTKYHRSNKIISHIQFLTQTQTQTQSQTHSHSLLRKHA